MNNIFITIDQPFATVELPSLLTINKPATEFLTETDDRNVIDKADIVGIETIFYQW